MTTRRSNSASAAALATVTCNGVPATIVGTSADNVIYGTNGNDVINALEGNDTVFGLGGDDAICGNVGNDTIYGSIGNDIMYGGTGFDALHGHTGHDRMITGAPFPPGQTGAMLPETMTGGLDNDRFDGTGSLARADFSLSATAIGVNLMTGVATGEGSDTLVAVTEVFGSALADSLVGTSERDRIDGKGGDDRIWGGAGDDVLIGGDNDDTIHGNEGNDWLQLDTSLVCLGANGNDTINGGPGSDYACDGLGTDRIDMSYVCSSSLCVDNDRVILDKFDYSPDVVHAGIGDDTVIFVGAGYSEGWFDHIDCGAGSDTLDRRGVGSRFYYTGCETVIR